jgi:hypothetical protein
VDLASAEGLRLDHFGVARFIDPLDAPLGGRLIRASHARSAAFMSRTPIRGTPLAALAHHCSDITRLQADHSTVVTDHHDQQCTAGNGVLDKWLFQLNACEYLAVILSLVMADVAQQRPAIAGGAIAGP